MIFRAFASLFLALTMIGAASAGYVRNDPMNATDPDGTITVFIDGAGDQDGPLPVAGSGIVEDYAAKYAAENPDRTVAYFGEQQGDTAIFFINNEIASGNDEPINIIGMSYGAATAVRVAKGVDGTVDTLIGVDPVGKPGIPNTTSASTNVRRVIEVRNDGRGSLGGELAETFGKAFGGVPDAFEETQFTITTPYGHEVFGPAFEHDQLPWGSAKRIVDETYD